MGGKFVRSTGRKVGVACAPERVKMMLGGKGAMEGNERGAHV